MLQFIDIDMDLNTKLYLNCTLPTTNNYMLRLEIMNHKCYNPLPYFCTVDISLCQLLNSSYWLDCLETPHNIEQNILMHDQKDWRSDNRILDKRSTYFIMLSISCLNWKGWSVQGVFSLLCSNDEQWFCVTVFVFN